jgi:hypothetical protein
MMVFEALSLYTTHLGWQMYDLIFDAFSQLGLWAIGLLMIGFRYLKATATASGEGHYSGNHALNVFILELLLFFIICIAFVYPGIPYSAQENTFRPICNAEGVADSKVNDTGTTYDDDFIGMTSDTVRLPLGFSVEENVTSALTYSLMKIMSCKDGLNSIKADMISSHLPSTLKGEVSDFKNQCYFEAKLRFQKNQPELSTYSDVMNKYGGRDDLAWVGSHVFRELYYTDIKAKSPVKRYKYSQYPSDNFDQSDVDGKLKPDHGYPDCNSWWVDIRGSLKDLLEDNGFKNAHEKNRAIYLRTLRVLHEHNVAGQQHAAEDEVAKDLIARTLIENTDDVIDRGGAFQSNNNGFQGGVSNWLMRTGQAVKSWTITPLKRQAIKQTLPIMLALFSFFVTVFMAPVVMLSGCSPKAVGAFVGLKFILIFMHFIFFSVTWLTSFLLQAVSGNGELTSNIQNMLVMFYFVAAILFMKLSAVWGSAGAAGLVDMVVGAKTASEEAERAGGTTARVASKAIFKKVGGK